MVKCGNCHKSHKNSAEVRDCFGKTRVAATDTAGSVSRKTSCWKCHELHGDSLADSWSCQDRVRKLANIQSVDNSNEPGESNGVVPARSISCGHVLHHHSSIIEARNCYLSRSNKKLFKKPARKCRHGILIDSCHDCAKPPQWVNEIVYITKGGSKFHNSRDCKSLEQGQDDATALGYTNHPIRLMPWSSLPFEREACRDCVKPKTE
jgi:hypothetical protein